MDGIAEKSRKHSDHCLELAAKAPDEATRRWFLKLAKLFEYDGHLVARSKLQVIESKELLARVAALLADSQIGT